jgi:preprotein translocase subunit SecD
LRTVKNTTTIAFGAIACLMAVTATLAVLPTSPVFQIRQVRGSNSKAPALDECDRMVIQHKGKLGGRDYEEVRYVEKPVLLDESSLVSARAVSNQLAGRWSILITFTEAGLKRFNDLVKKRPAVIIDGRLWSANFIVPAFDPPTAPLPAPMARLITGEFSEREARDLANRITQVLRK